MKTFPKPQNATKSDVKAARAYIKHIDFWCVKVNIRNFRTASFKKTWGVEEARNKVRENLSYLKAKRIAVLNLRNVTA